MFKKFFKDLKQEFAGYNSAKLMKDVMAGLTVCAVALPLALAFGVSSGASAASGLVTAIIAGVVIAILGGASYQISGPTGSMAAVLKGKVDGILLTGGLVIYDDLCEQIRERCGWISDIYIYPGELEQEALAKETLKALRGQRTIHTYDGIPPFDGFDFIEE
jgi:hypothetical protein